MKLRFIEDKQEWNELVGEIHPSQFLQSWQWGEFQKLLGRRIWRFVIEREGRLVCASQAIEHRLPFGLTYVYIPRGPIITPFAKNHREDFLKIFQEEVKRFIQPGVFIRAESVDFNFGRDRWLKVNDIQPSNTNVLSLDKSEDDILADMHQKTRYNIRLADKRGVTVCQMKDSEFDKFWDLISITTERDKFRPHPKDYYKKMLDSLGDMAQVWFAEYQGKVLAANLMIFWGDKAIYLHGASSNEHRNVMAPYLLHWEMIKKAKAEGFEHYDFWGIAPENEPDHPWAGITRFKKGFGGTEVSYPGTFDLPLKKFWYLLYRLRKGK